MIRLFSLYVLCVGLLLMIYGFSISDSLGTSFSRLFNASPTDRGLWFLIGGSASIAIGASGLFRRGFRSI